MSPARLRANRMALSFSFAIHAMRSRSCGRRTWRRSREASGVTVRSNQLRRLASITPGHKNSWLPPTPSRFWAAASSVQKRASCPRNSVAARQRSDRGPRDAMPVLGWVHPILLGRSGFAFSRLVRVLRWRVAIRACGFCESACIGPGPVFEDPRAAGAAPRGASGTGHQGGRDRRFGVPLPGGCGVFAEFDGRGGGVSPLRSAGMTALRRIVGTRARRGRQEGGTDALLAA